MVSDTESIRYIERTFNELSTDVERERDGASTIYSIDFSDIYPYIFSVYPEEKYVLERCIFHQFKEQKYAVFPPTIYDLIFVLQHASDKLRQFGDLHKKLRGKDYETFIHKMSIETGNQRYVSELTLKRNDLKLIFNLIKPEGFSKMIQNPVTEFIDLIKKMEKNKILISYSDVKIDTTQKKAFEEKEVYSLLFSYLQSHEDRWEKSNANQMDALMAQINWQFDKYCFPETSEYFTYFTSSSIPLSFLRKPWFIKKACFDEPFKNTSFGRDPLYALLKLEFQEYSNSKGELKQYLNAGRKIFNELYIISSKYDTTTESKMENMRINLLESIKNKPMEDCVPELIASYLFIDALFYNNYYEVFYKDLNRVLGKNNYKPKPFLSALENVQYDSSQDDFKKEFDLIISLDKEETEDQIAKIDEKIPDYMSLIHSQLIHYVKDFDSSLITPGMEEINKKYHLGGIK
jgi:hypothetical protein